MKNFLNRSRRMVGIGAIAALTLVGSATAATISGSLPFAYIGTTQSSTNLGDPTDVLTIPLVLSSGAGVGDYAAIPSGSSYGSATLNLNTIATGGGFAISGPSGSTFTATFGTIVSQGCTQVNPFSCALDVYLQGIATLSGFAPTVSSYRTNFNQSDTSVSGSGTLTSPALPPPGVPEPTTMALFGSGLIAAGLLRKKFAK